jgi:hypothetical protein
MILPVGWHRSLPNTIRNVHFPSWPGTQAQSRHISKTILPKISTSQLVPSKIESPSQIVAFSHFWYRRISLSTPIRKSCFSSLLSPPTQFPRFFQPLPPRIANRQPLAEIESPSQISTFPTFLHRRLWFSTDLRNSRFTLLLNPETQSSDLFQSISPKIPALQRLPRDWVSLTNPHRAHHHKIFRSPLVIFHWSPKLSLPFIV